MSFISYEFLIFLAAVLVANWTIPQRFTNVFLLAASYLFYGWWDWRFLGLLLISSIVDFVCGRLLDGRVPSHRRMDVLAVSLATNLGLLIVCKYYDFFAKTLSASMQGLGIEVSPPLMQLILPVGISFYTFQTLSYTVDIYRGKMKSTSNFLDFLLYVSFFPQLVAGPIERAAHLLPQISAPRRFHFPSFTSGAQLALVGFFKKMVIADNLAPIVDSVYGNPASLSSPEATNAAAVLVSTYAFAIQIYCDFSGYTDIARGVARMLGFDLGVNFNLPYFSASPSEFWRRWHISLSTWFRDYVYIPLGGNRTGSRQLTNLVVVMFLAGLWHGANWTFVIWGLYHGSLLVAYHAWNRNATRSTSTDHPDRPLPRVAWIIKVILFFQLTTLGWGIFRASSLTQLRSFASCMLDRQAWNFATVDINHYYQLAVFGVPFFIFQALQLRKGQPEIWNDWNSAWRVGFFAVLFYGIVLLGTPDQQPFIYFQF